VPPPMLQQQEQYQGPIIVISDQPPQRCIYKRNVKPAPILTIEGHDHLNDGTLFVAPVLIRCDTMEEQSKLIAGNAPVKVMATRSIPFKKLKILQTSHQLDETLFSLRFELRKYSNDTFEVLHSCTTNPFYVCSHSSQLNGRASKILPCVTDVIPYGGPPAGGTRVAILGSNFEDSPTARVKFDEIEVMATFHGTKTLIVNAPKHLPGTVQVRVCNVPNQWSSTAGVYTYQLEKEIQPDPEPTKARQVLDQPKSKPLKFGRGVNYDLHSSSEGLSNSMDPFFSPDDMPPFYHSVCTLEA